MESEDRTRDDERRAKFIASGFVQRKAPETPKYPWVLSLNDRRFLRSLKIDPDR